MPKIIFRPNPTPPPFVPPGPTLMPLTFRALEDNVNLGFFYYCTTGQAQDAGLNIEYSIDNGLTWNPYQVSLSPESSTIISLNRGEFVSFRGVNENLAYNVQSLESFQATKFYSTGSVSASGDLTSLLNGIGGDIECPIACFALMFANCTNLIQAPNLPSSILGIGAYAQMFSGCTSLMQAPSLPATTLNLYCYTGMFSGCTSLMQAPSLPATTLNSYCYSDMFSGCTSLTQAPSLPATTLSIYCYSRMFSDCTSLTQAPSLPATTLAAFCYTGMFSGCTSLSQAPSLPAMTLSDSCYLSMFSYCTSLTQAPSLPATTLVEDCYKGMFYGCSSLSHIEAMFTTEPSSLYTENWVFGVAQNGTFVKNSQASWDVSGANGIPTGWTVVTQ